MFFERIDSPIGLIGIEADESSLRSVLFDSQDPDPRGRIEKSNFVTELVKRELREYFDGVRTTFTASLLFAGTPFQKRAWKALLEIPFGETRTYGMQAAAIGVPKASRAVGSANGKNRIGVIVPCHRVVGANGTLTGYGGGIERKRWLLEHEQAVLHSTTED
ncbi:MAG: methylated-DNA--[protein]-cysteine S-methyltransferase [Planctomycetota bacterium]